MQQPGRAAPLGWLWEGARARARPKEATRMRVRLGSAVRAARTTRALGGSTRSAWSAAAAVLVRVLTREAAASAVALLARAALVRAALVRAWLVRAPQEAVWCAVAQLALRINTVVPLAPASAARLAKQVVRTCPRRALVSPAACVFVGARAISVRRVHSRSSAAAAEARSRGVFGGCQPGGDWWVSTRKADPDARWARNSGRSSSVHRNVDIASLVMAFA